ncbi:MAG: ion channel [Sediminibacterium sp.]|nr:ion channel [Sediminibacterium sp.]
MSKKTPHQQQHQHHQEISTVQKDLGFGTFFTSNRSMNKDGSFNVRKIGVPKFKTYEIYHHLISMSWGKFLFIVFLVYFLANILFALLYYYIGSEHLSFDSLYMNEFEKFIEVFFFSSQTLTTLGYGRIAPVGSLASTVAAVESMCGLLGFALATGLLYGRFSKPHSKIIYSDCAIISPYKNIKGLMFRITNLRNNQLIEIEAEVTLGYNDINSGVRNFVSMPLERPRINLFPLSWTIVHPIIESSKLFGLSGDDMMKMNLEIYVLIKAYDETFSQHIYSRTSYTGDEIIYGAHFLPMFKPSKDNILEIDISLINAIEKVEFKS